MICFIENSKMIEIYYEYLFEYFDLGSRNCQFNYFFYINNFKRYLVFLKNEVFFEGRKKVNGVLCYKVLNLIDFFFIVQK